MSPSNAELIEEMRWQVRKIRDRQAENDALLGKLDTMRSRLTALEVRVSSPDGTVTVVAGAGGIVRGVELADTAVRGTASALAATLNATIRQAVREATERQLELVRGSVGADVDPERVLGPRAKLTGYGLADPEPEPAPAPAPTEEDEEPRSIFEPRRW
ncbi:YbaB/EbfC family nucleoid-associated protein [Amycolatopsis arida]|uniref:YbaB/EbfC family nucleoid-associated protein n=1 Tax=Amycolatopsis arida TaxID=587909 RepID=UPI0014170138|nr:YbaB/EbfC family nucleoid-associated protein [Amycolatopsis arida]